jgi:hypothetical protein
MDYFSLKIIIQIKIEYCNPKQNLRKKRAAQRNRNSIDFQSALAFSPKRANVLLLLFKSLLGEKYIDISLGN